MAQADWNDIANSVDAASLARGATAGIDRPPGGGTHVYAWRSLTAGVTGAHALNIDLGGFNPTPNPSGGQITSALIRKNGDPALMATFMYYQLSANDINTGEGYILGLSAGDPGNIVLRKGTLGGGLPDALEGEQGILRKSTDSVALDTWVHLRLDVVANPSGDVILKCFQNDLTVNDVTTPVWEAIAGMPDFNDDALGVNSGSPGLDEGGLAGVGFFIATSGVVGAVDHTTVSRDA